MFNTLKYLMNYSAYVSHLYKETVLDINEKLKERDELQRIKYQLRKTIEEAKIKQENNHKEIKNLDVEIPRQKAHVVELQEEQRRLKHKILKVTEKSEKIEVDLDEIKSDLERLKKSAMSEEEIEGIFAAKANVMQRLEEQNQFAAAVRQKMKENSQKIEEIQEITKKMEALTIAFNIDPEKIKSLKKQVGKVEETIMKLKADIVERQEEIAALSQAFAAKKREANFKTNQLQEAKKSFSIKEAEQAKQLKATRSLLHKLATKEAILSATYKRLRLEQQQMYRIATNVIKHISTQMMDNEDKEN